MMGCRSAQRSLFGAQVHYLDFVGADSFYGFLAERGRELFRDEDFAGLPMPSVHDPEQRHGHKSHGRTFAGHKAGVAVDTESQLITAVGVQAANEPDGAHATELVDSSEANTGSEVEQVIGDTAYGSMETREALGEREVLVPTVKPHSKRSISKDDFEIDVEHGRVVCPEGHETSHWTWTWIQPGVGKPKVRTKRFAFPKELCRACPRYAECVTGKRRRGRFVTLHPDEARLQAGRAVERTEYFREQYRQRVIVEHRIARLVPLGIRQSRYFGRKKTLFQVLMAATLANLTLVANWQASKRLLRRLSGALRRLLGRVVVACGLLPRPGRRLVPVAA